MRNADSVAAVALACLLSACGASKEETRANGSSLHFITFGPGVTGLVAAAKDPTMRICIYDATGQADQSKWAADLKSTVLKWIKPLRALTSDRLTSDVQIVQSGCHFDLQIAPNTHSNTSIGQRPTIRMGPDGYMASYNVLLHEMGHAFALSDTYQNGQSGDCQPGQPQAVMCNTSFDEPQADDIAGLTQIFKQVFPGDQPPLEPPPPPLPIEPKHEMFAAIGKETAVDTYELAASVVGVASEAGEMSFCPDTLAVCSGSEALWRIMPKSGTRTGNTTVYTLNEGHFLKHDRGMTFRFEDVNGAEYLSINARNDT